MYYVEVLVPLHIDKTLTYYTQNKLTEGQIVCITVNKKEYLGIIYKLGLEKPQFETKPIKKALALKVPKKTLEFIQWVSCFTLAPLNVVSKMVIPIKNIQQISKPAPPIDVMKKIALSKIQKNVLEEIEEHINQKPIVIDGVTGSGKTEVYLELVRKTLEKNKQVLILLPEIALTQQLIQRIKIHLGIDPFVWHARVTPSKKAKIWNQAISTECGLFIGARSSLFLPYQNLGLIVIDEEHDTSYKQDSHVLYHGRDMAVVKATLEKIPIILASATPSIETINNIATKKYHCVKLNKRYGNQDMPKVDIIDMKQCQQLLSPELKESLTKNLNSKNQSLLFLNRRGYAPILLCTECGYRKTCTFCSTNLVLHKENNKILCHHCGYSINYQTDTCKKCKDIELIPWGPGIEKVYEEIKTVFPTANTITMASDQITSPKKLKEYIDQILNNQVDIIIGTQILAKGHHFPNLTLVGVIDADMGLYGIDFRNTEQTYQLLHQVSGRCGREHKAGKVLIQTYNPLHPAIMNLAKNTKTDFEKYELNERQKSQLPPFTKLAAITVSGRNLSHVKNYSNELFNIHPKNQSIKVFQPAPAALKRLRMMYRYRILIKDDSSKNWILQSYISQWLEKIRPPKSLKISIDINPYNFM